MEEQLALNDVPDLLSDTENDEIDLLYVRKVAAQTRELHKWQTKATEYFLEHKWAVFEIPTGVGKTYCAINIISEIIKKEPNMRVLIVVPKNVILEKTWIPELFSFGMTFKDVGVYYGLAKEMGKITVTNMQNLDNINFQGIDMFIIDELHNFGTPRLKEFLAMPFKYKLGLTATLDSEDQKKKWELLDFFEYNHFLYSPKQALDDGILNPFHFINLGVKMDEHSFEEYNKMNQDLAVLMKSAGGPSVFMRCPDLELKNKILFALTKRKQHVVNYPGKFQILREIITNHKGKKIIVFNEFNEHSNRCFWETIETGVKGAVINSDIPKEVAEDAVTNFRTGKISILFLSKSYDEGWNLPSAEVAIVLAGGLSSRQTIQRAGRVLRKKDVDSYIYQIYVWHTFEEEHALKRANMLKELAKNYKSEIRGYC